MTVMEGGDGTNGHVEVRVVTASSQIHSVRNTKDGQTSTTNGDVGRAATKRPAERSEMVQTEAVGRPELHGRMSRAADKGGQALKLAGCRRSGRAQSEPIRRGLDIDQ